MLLPHNSHYTAIISWGSGYEQCGLGPDFLYYNINGTHDTRYTPGEFRVTIPSGPAVYYTFEFLLYRFGFEMGWLSLGAEYGWKAITPATLYVNSVGSGSTSTSFPSTGITIDFADDTGGDISTVNVPGDPPVGDLGFTTKLSRYWEVNTTIETFAADLSVSYDPAEIPEGVLEENLISARYNEQSSQWQVLPTTIDPVNHIATASGLNEVSVFVIASIMDPVAVEESTWGKIKNINK